MTPLGFVHSNVVATLIKQNDVAEEIRALGGLAKLDYVDVVVATASNATDASPEEWARAAMEGASPAGRFLAWQVLCGLRLEPSPDRIAGWKIAERGENWIRMEASSSFMSARIVFKVEEEHVSFATFIRYDRAMAAAVWGSVSAIHRAVAPDFLRAAVKRIERRTGRSYVL